LIDWHHPEFPIDIFHPLRDHPEAEKLNQSRNIKIYSEYIYNQIEELLTQFDLDILWCDFSYPDREYKEFPGKGRADWQSEKLVEMIRRISPKIILNNRLDLSGAADIYTPEQVQPTEWVKVEGEPVVWEACQTFSGSWGYHRDEETWKSPGQLIRMLVNTVACGGNLLVNVGPTSLGTFDSRTYDALSVYQNWMELHSESIYGCTQSEFTAPQDCRLTQNGNKLYVHVYAWPFKFIHLEGLGGKISYARFLHDGSEVDIHMPGWELKQLDLHTKTQILSLPIKKPDVVVPVIELTLKK
jgi:alpha-L-fucosidase